MRLKQLELQETIADLMKEGSERFSETMAKSTENKYYREQLMSGFLLAVGAYARSFSGFTREPP